MIIPIEEIKYYKFQDLYGPAFLRWNFHFHNYNLIKKDDFNKILNVRLENELVTIATGNLEEILKKIEIDELGNFKNLK